MNFGEKLKFYRKKNKLTQKDMAEKLNISQRAYVRYESNDARPRKFETYDKLADILGCNRDELIVGDSVDFTQIGKSFIGVGTTILLLGLNPIGGGIALSAKAFSDMVKKEGISKMQGKQLIESHKKQKSFEYQALGIIKDTLRSKLIKYDEENVDKYSNMLVVPNTSLRIIDKEIDEWWLECWKVNREIESDSFISDEDRAKIIFGKYAVLNKNMKRKVSIIVDDENIYNSLKKIKNNNSLKANISVVKISINNMEVEKEEYISLYNDDIKLDEMLLV